MTTSMALFYDLVQSSELTDALAIEQQGFPPDEAAALQSFQYRQSHAPHLFLGIFEHTDEGARRILGYVCSTQALATTLEHDSMSTHVEQGRSVCIHSVCIHPRHKRQGLGKQLLKEYILRLEATESYDVILLICHDHLRKFYEDCGFAFVGESKVQHGAGKWYEMRIDLAKRRHDSAHQAHAQEQSQEMPAGLWEALQASSAKERPTPLSSHQPPENASVTAEDGSISNKYDLLCPRSGCSSIILKKGVAKLVERSSVQIDPSLPEGSQTNPLLPALPSPPDTTAWWLVTPSPMAFENIGFSKSVPQPGKTESLKLLICAECDLGPLGWCEPGGSEFWLACQRVAYRQE